MAQTNEHQTKARREELFDLAETWASMTKDLSIYPETNQRIQKGLASFLSKLHEALGKHDQIEITIHLEKVRVGTDEIPFPPHCTLPWLRARLDAFGYAGFSFSKKLVLVDLLQYSLEISRPRTGEELQEPTPVPGIQPVARVFGASQLGREHDPAHFLEHPLIAEICEASEEVRNKIEILRKSVEEMKGEERLEITPENLISILPYLPETLEDAEGQVFNAKELSLLLARLQKENLLPQDQESSWSHLLNRIGRNLFGNDQPVTEQPKPLSGAARGHANDDKIEEDLSCFLQEFAALPEGEVVLQGHADPGFEEELLASYLELLLNDQDPKHREKIGLQLVPMIEKPDPKLRQIVRSFLDPKESPLWRIGELVDWLRDNGLLSLARGCGAFDPKEAVQRFPVGFLTYMDTFDPGSETDVAEFAALCAEIGAKRILEAQELLILTGGLEPHGRKEILFQGRHVEVLPLLHVHLHECGQSARDRVVRHLRHLVLGSRESCVLKILRDSEDIPMEYLMDLTARDDNGRYPATIRNRIITVLRDLLTTDSQDKYDLATRTYAVRKMGEFRAQEAKGLLEELARQKGFLGLGNRQKIGLAKAARQALNQLKG